MCTTPYRFGKKIFFSNSHLSSGWFANIRSKYFADDTMKMDVQSEFFLLLVPIDNGAGTLAWKVFGNFLLQLVKAGKTNNKVSTTINP